MEAVYLFRIEGEGHEPAEAVGERIAFDSSPDGVYLPVRPRLLCLVGGLCFTAGRYSAASNIAEPWEVVGRYLYHPVSVVCCTPVVFFVIVGRNVVCFCHICPPVSVFSAGIVATLPFVKYGNVAPAFLLLPSVRPGSDCVPLPRAATRLPGHCVPEAAGRP